MKPVLQVSDRAQPHAIRLQSLLPVITLLIIMLTSPRLSHAAPAAPAQLAISLSDYSSGPIDQWLQKKGFRSERDARDRNKLFLSINDGALTLQAKQPLFGLFPNDQIKVAKVGSVKINWGVNEYPQGASYARGINNEALMVFFFFGAQKISSGSLLVPASPYFIGLYLCQNDTADVPNKGRYFHQGGRYVCVGKPKPGETVSSEFDLNSAFKTYFGQSVTPPISGIALEVDTSHSGNNGKSSGFIRSIEFIDGAGASPSAPPVTR